MRSPIYNNVAIVTGATGAIGRELVLEQVRNNVPVILACRNIRKAEALVGDIKKEYPAAILEVRQLCLESKESIKNFVGWVREQGISVSVLFNNAGVMQRHYEINEDGIELSFMVNYIGTLLLTMGLMPSIVKEGHVVFTTSVTRKLFRAQDIVINEPESRFSQLLTYGRSKAALTHYAKHLAEQNRDIYINCADPGVVDSNMITMKRWYDPIANLFFRPFIRTPRQGAVPALRASVLTSSGNVATKRSINAITYDTDSEAHKNLIKLTDGLLSSLTLK